MNAMLSEDVAERRMHGVDRSALEYALQAWGQWIETHADYEGYPRSDAVAAWLSGAGGGERGHRVLCLDMPVRIYATHGRVVLLPEHEREVVWAHYVPTMRDDGQAWTPRQKAERLGIEWEAYRKRLSRARFRILGLPVPL
jgi:hypothetical protein